VPCRRFRAIVWRVILVALALFWACIGYLVFG
jgi:hypothetical protein